MWSCPTAEQPFLLARIGVANRLSHIVALSALLNVPESLSSCGLILGLRQSPVEVSFVSGLYYSALDNISIEGIRNGVLNKAAHL
jgi:hypothetical protein